MDSRPAGLKALAVIEAVFAVTGLASGLMLLLSPSGSAMGLSLDLLDNAPVGDFALVGVFFVAFYAILPALGAYGLWTRKRWRWTDVVNRWTGQLWGWTASAAVGVTLIVWIAVELVLMGFLTGSGGVLQVAMTLLGVLLLALAMLPSVRSATKLED